MQDVAAVARVRVFEVAAGGDAEVADHLGGVGTAQRLDLFEGPQVELAFDPFGVGVFGGVEPAVGMVQVAEHVLDDLLDDASIAREPDHEPTVQVRAGEQRLVVEHLLEVGDQPVRVDGIAVEPAAHLVVHPAGCHRVERHRDRLERLRRRVAHGLGEEEREGHRLRELRRGAEATEAWVELRVDRGDGDPEHVC